MSISTIQELFLSLYLSSKGNLHGTLITINLDYNDFLIWRDNSDFDFKFRVAQRNILSLLDEENHLMSKKYINEVLSRGYVAHNSVKHMIQHDADGKPQVLTQVTEKKSGIPPSILKLASSEMTIMKAIKTLLIEGIIPSEMAKKLISKASEISYELQETFNNDTPQNTIDEEKAIALIQQSILGGDT